MSRKQIMRLNKQAKRRRYGISQVKTFNRSYEQLRSVTGRKGR